MTKRLESGRFLLFTLLAILSITKAFIVSPQASRGKLLDASPYKILVRGPRFHMTRNAKETDEATALPGLFDGDSNNSDGRLSMVLFQVQEALNPAARVLDDATDGWALSYANLSPENESTTLGQAFLASNLAYALCGLLLSVQGEFLLGFMCEICAAFSWLYHYTQLQASTNKENDDSVRLALMIDYIFALTSIFIALGYLLTDQHQPPIEAIVSGGVSLGFLGACWIWESTLPYIIFHSLWHLASAYTGYIVGVSHLS